MLQYFGLKSLSVEDLADHVLKLTSNQTYFGKYYRVNTVMLEEADGNCDQNCRRYHFCAQYYQDYQQFESCIQSKDSGSNQLIVSCVALCMSMALVKFMN